MPKIASCEFDEAQLLASAAAEIYGMRRARDQLMPPGLVGEPAWDMLLALYSEQPGCLSLTCLCHGSGVPSSSAHRWVRALEHEGFIERTSPPHGGSAPLLSLTKMGREIVERSLKAMLRVPRE
jgi:DNA-binding MarR family transcriptional regulator